MQEKGEWFIKWKMHSAVQTPSFLNLNISLRSDTPWYFSPLLTEEVASTWKSKICSTWTLVCQIKSQPYILKHLAAEQGDEPMRFI